jgi:uncharacterized membrane protein YcaP (DUF421 family)
LLWLEFVWRVLIMAAVLIGAVWVIGPRSISQARLIDSLFITAIAGVAGLTAVNLGILVPGALIVLAVLVGTYYLLNRFALSKQAVRKLLAWRPLVLIDDGRIDIAALRRANIDLDQLLAKLRRAGLFSLDEAETVLLEPTGDLSVLRKGEGGRFSRPVVIDGAIDDAQLKATGRTRDWLNEELAKRGIDLKQVFLAVYSRKGELYVAEKEQRSGE